MAADDEESVIHLSRFLYRVCYSAFTLSVQSLLFSFHASCYRVCYSAFTLSVQSLLFSCHAFCTESVIQLSRFLYRVFDMRNRAVSSEWMKFSLCSTEIKVLEVKDKWTVDLKQMCEVNLYLKCTTVLNRFLMLQCVIFLCNINLRFAWVQFPPWNEHVLFIQ